MERHFALSYCGRSGEAAPVEGSVFVADCKGCQSAAGSADPSRFPRNPRTFRIGRSKKVHVGRLLNEARVAGLFDDLERQASLAMFDPKRLREVQQLIAAERTAVLGDPEAKEPEEEAEAEGE